MKSSDGRTDIKALSKSELAAWLQQAGIDAYRAGQIFKWVYVHQQNGFEQMTNLSKAIRKQLAEHFTIARLRIKAQEPSRDGSRKYLFELSDGQQVESVLIAEKDHYTLCVSSQVGCALGCRFCLTGRAGLTRHLTRAEIIGQVRDVLFDLAQPGQLSNLVFMGMGEPLANYTNLVGALETICDAEAGLKFSSRRVTVSTAGLVPRLRDLGRDTRVNLAVSLNATDNDTRSRLMPINRTYPLEALLAACKIYPLPPRRRITIEYVMLAGINDSARDARRLVELLRPIRAKVNLIPFNPHAGCRYDRPADAAIEAFQYILQQAHLTVLIRQSKGADISAACGQLGARAAGCRP